MTPPTPAVQIGASAEEQELKQASAALGVPFVRLVTRTIPQAVLEKVPIEAAQSYQIVPYEESELASGKHVLRLAVSSPDALEKEAPPAVNELHVRDGFLIEVALTTKADIAAVLNRYPKPLSKATKQTSLPKTAKKPAASDSPPAIDLTNRLIPRVVLERIPEETARKYRAVVFDVSSDNKTIQVALENPDNPQVQDFLGFLRDQANLDIKLFQTSAASITKALEGYLPAQETNLPEERQLVDPGIHSATKSQAGTTTGPLFTKQPANFWDEDTASQPAKLATLPAIESASNVATAADANPKPLALKSLPVLQTQPVSPVDSIEVPAVNSQEVQRANLLVSKEEASLLIPVSADVERDILAVVGQEVKTIADLESIVRTGFIPKIVGAIVLLAAELLSSDIHIQADEKSLLVRFRVDGILSDIIKIPLTLQAPIISRIKILAKLKIDEQRVPQDGRFDVQIGTRQVDLRVSTFPTVRGEKVVIRLLDKSAGLLKLEQLGLTGSRLERLRAQITKPYGVVLSTGPTGSGKSTTLYAILQEIASPEVNVVTLEDPVEYEIPGINQAQIKPKIGFGFAEGLRSVLRQDPNIIMVGEIRDLETASMMTHAALTGHLVLSTLHTNDAAGALPRLTNMGVEPFLITSAMNGVVAQRLVRKLCAKCRVPWTPSSAIADDVKKRLTPVIKNAELQAAVDGPATFFKPHGCSECHDGFKGRLGIFEVLVMSQTIEDLTVKKAPGSELAAAAIKEGMVTMEQDGLMKVLSGQTTLEEVLRVTKAE